MDISAFSDESFDVKNWINESLRNVKDQENKSVYVGNMVKKLQLYVQQVNSGLEEISEQVVSSLPRITRDANTLSHEAVMLQQKMCAVKQEIIDVEKNTRSSMASLERIDKIKSELLSAKRSLHEADNWTLMTTDIEEIFEKGDIEEIANKIVSMQQCLNVLTKTPDYEEKTLQLETLKNRLEAIASPQLVQAFSSKVVENAHKFVRIFSSMERLSQLLQYYDKCQKCVFLEKWKLLTELDDVTVEELLKQYYDFMLSEWQTQVKWCTQLLPNTISINNLLAELYIDVLDSLGPNTTTLIQSAIREQTEPITLLSEIQVISFNFDEELQNLFLNRKDAEEMKLSQNLKQVIHGTYASHINNYMHLQYDTMKALLEKEGEVIREDILDQIEGLSHATTAVFNIMNDSCVACFKLSKGCVVTQFIESCNKFLLEYLNQYSYISKQITQKNNEEKVDAWSIFQICLAFMQRLGDVLSRTYLWSQQIADQVNQHKSEASEYAKLYLTIEKNQQFNSFLVLLEQDDAHQFLPSVVSKVEKLCKSIHQITYQVIFTPISSYINKAQTSWTQGNQRKNLPDYSFTPQEYITQIGEYLLTLPQHLEPFLLNENPSLNMALEAADNEYKQEGCGSANILLGMLARGTCHAMCDRILLTTSLSSSSSKQLVTDIEYLGNVLEELDVELTENLMQILTLLKLDPQNYHSQSIGCSHRLVASIREMRNIPSSN